MKKSLLAAGAVLVIVIAGATAFMTRGPHAESGHGAGPHGMPPAMPAQVTVVEEKPLRLWTSYSGRLEAVEFVELRPQVDGRIQEVKFEDGQLVNEGDVLFVIDPRPYEARVAEAQAAIKAAQSQHELAVKELKRAEDLIKTDTISKRVLDERQSAAQVAKNTLTRAEATLESAQIDLDRAFVKAPISGRVSRPEITVGNVVQAGPNAPVLTTIVSDEGIYADFDVDEQTYLQNIRPHLGGGQNEKTIPVQLVLSDGSVVEDGYIKSFDNRIDTSTGTIRARAYFNNEDGSLLPGMFVTVKLGSPADQTAILLTEHAIGTDQNRKFVYVVGADNKVAYREVQLGATVNGQRVVTGGLTPGEKVIAEGIMKIMPDMQVVPQIVGAEQQGEGAPLPETAPAAGK